jgi:hypothetical protein
MTIAAVRVHLLINKKCLICLRRKGKGEIADLKYKSTSKYKGSSKYVEVA